MIRMVAGHSRRPGLKKKLVAGHVQVGPRSGQSPQKNLAAKRNAELEIHILKTSKVLENP